MSEIDLRKAEREHVRWLILSALNSARPFGTTDEIVHSAIVAVPIPFTLMEIRRELDYLEEGALIEISGRDRPNWFAKLTRDGIDVVEYTVDCHPGIARPKKWF